jgi:hypothetical protein
LHRRLDAVPGHASVTPPCDASRRRSVPAWLSPIGLGSKTETSVVNVGSMARAFLPSGERRNGFPKSPFPSHPRHAPSTFISKSLGWPVPIEVLAHISFHISYAQPRIGLRSSKLRSGLIENRRSLLSVGRTGCTRKLRIASYIKTNVRAERNDDKAT